MADWLARAAQRHLRWGRWEGGWTPARAAGMLVWSLAWALAATLLAVLALLIGTNGASVQKPSLSQQFNGWVGVLLAGACLAAGPGRIWCHTRSPVFGAISAFAVLAGALLGLSFFIFPS